MTKRPPLKPCSWSSRCSRRPKVTISEDERYCDRHATWVADKLVGDWVKERDGHRCQLAGFNGQPCIYGEVFWCHLIPKGRYPTLRYEPLNALSGCLAHHKAFDESPLEKDIWIRKYLGGDEYDALIHKALEAARVDKAEVIREFRQRKVTYEEGTSHRSHSSGSDGELMDG